MRQQPSIDDREPHLREAFTAAYALLARMDKLQASFAQQIALSKQCLEETRPFLERRTDAGNQSSSS